MMLHNTHINFQFELTFLNAEGLSAMCWSVEIFQGARTCHHRISHKRVSALALANKDAASAIADPKGNARLDSF